jgi:colanic acid/amylovoran biosynthesis protein
MPSRREGPRNDVHVMRALILWAEPESTNLGVRTLAAGTTRLLERAFPGIETEAQGFGAGDAPVRIGAWRGQVKRLFTPHDGLVDWVKRFDLIVDTRGGDSFTDIYGLPRLTTMGLMAEIARRARVPVVMGPQTIGPFESRYAKGLARRTLHTSRLVFARDAVSATEARRWSGREPELTTDVVFALDDAVPSPVDRDVILNASGLLWAPNSHVDHLRYRELLIELCRRLSKLGRRVSLLANVLDSPLADNDVTAVRALAGELDDECEILVPSDLDDARSLLASANVVVGSRMHACLNALSVGRPAIPLAYSRKFAPLLGDLGWNQTIDIRTPGDHVGQVMSALDESGLERDITGLRARAEERVESARRALDRAF